jgi:hypothetical protein
LDATAAYLDAEDAISAWIEECCAPDQNTWTPSNALFASWRVSPRRGSASEPEISEMARPTHVPDAFHRRQVEALAGYGVPEAEIAGMVGVDPKTLRKHYRHELAFGHTKANAKVAENLFRKATGEGRESVIAAIFWLKARGRLCDDSYVGRLTTNEMAGT